MHHSAVVILVARPSPTRCRVRLPFQPTHPTSIKVEAEVTKNYHELLGNVGKEPSNVFATITQPSNVFAKITVADVCQAC
jgi:hypothetical protein